MTTRTRKKRDAVRFLEKLSGGPLTLGKALRAIREGEGMSLATFAKQLDVSRQNLCDIEQGRRSVSPARAAHWATILAYSETQFVRLALQDQIAEAGLHMRVSVDAA
jgi:transcriptional regulator with XRE-family HTH domain